MTTVISTVIEKKTANLVRTVLHASGIVLTQTLNDDSNKWVTIHKSSPLWGKLRYPRELHALRAN